MSSNPYAAPQSSSAIPSGATDCFRDGKVLIVPTGAALPGRCVKCNAPAEMEKPRTYAWHHPGWYVFILLNIIIYAVIAMIVQKRAKIVIGLCETHRRKRRNFTLSALALLVGGIALVMAAIGSEEDGALLGSAGGLLLLASAIVAIVGTRVLYASRITKEEAQLKGCGSAFLASLRQR